MDAGEPRLEMRGINALDVCRACASRIEQNAAQKGLAVIVDGDENVCLRADPKRLQDILDNLMQNGLHYTTHGYISLEVEVVNDTIVFCVSDTGRGIRNEDLGRLFNRFESVNAQSDAQVGLGAGLGLAIVHDLVKLQGGEVVITSVWGEGTCARVSLPAGYCQLENSSAA